MRTKNVLLSLLIAAGTGLPAASFARADVSVGISFGPPPPPAVVYIPPPQPGYYWASGYWGWDGFRHVWVDGRWLVARRGHVWVPDRWVQRGPHWRHVRGHWEPGHRDRGRHRGHRD